MTDNQLPDTALALRRAQALQRLLEGELSSLAIRKHAQRRAQDTMTEAVEWWHEHHPDEPMPEQEPRIIQRAGTALEACNNRVTRTEENIDALQAALAPLRFLLPEQEEGGSI